MRCDVWCVWQLIPNESRNKGWTLCALLIFLLKLGINQLYFSNRNSSILLNLVTLDFKSHIQMHITEWEFYNSVGGLSFPIAVGHNPRCERERQGKKISHLWTLYVAVLRIRIFFDRIQIRTCIHKHIIERSQSITFSRLYTTFSLIYKNMFKRKQWLMFVFFSEFKNAQNLIIPMEVVIVEAEKIFRVSFD